MKNNKPARKHSSTIVNQFLDDTSPAEKLQTSSKMALAVRLDDLIKTKGWGKSEFAEIVGKSPSEITKWLSGTQNFTIDTLAEIAVALKVPLSELFTARQQQVVNNIHIVLTSKEPSQTTPYMTPVTTETESLLAHCVTSSPDTQPSSLSYIHQNHN
jgi:transcriptional regulator with XRE-family HTH domain